MNGYFHNIHEPTPDNPISLGRPKAPRPYQTEKTKDWADDELNALLDAIAAKEVQT